LTDIATIDFIASKITYKRTLPLMNNNGMTTGVFVSDTLYYVGSSSSQFNDGQNNKFFNFLGWSQAIVYTSA
jgi:hypothetical protein